MPLKLIINADDFGMSTAVNMAIQKAFQNEWISSATLMANMPGFADACNWALQNNKIGAIGVHLNLYEGPSVTKTIRSFKKICDQDGCFNGALFKVGFEDITLGEREAIANEMRAQIQLLKDNGIMPSHIDSHHHLHYKRQIIPIVYRLAKENSISAVRMRLNLGVNRLPIITRLKEAIRNTTLYYRGLCRTRNIGRLIDMAPYWESLSGITEVIVHPIMLDNGSLVDEESGDDLSVLVSNIGDHVKYSFSDVEKSFFDCFPSL